MGTLDLCRDHDQALSRSTTPSLTRFRAAHIGLIHFQRVRKAISSRPDHGPPELVEPSPGRVIAAQTENLLEAQRADARFLTGHPPHRPEPDGQWFASTLEYGTRRHGDVVAARSTDQQSTNGLPYLATLATRARNSLRPTQLQKILTASTFGREPRLEFTECLRVVFHTPVAPDSEATISPGHIGYTFGVLEFHSSVGVSRRRSGGNCGKTRRQEASA